MKFAYVHLLATAAALPVYRDADGQFKNDKNTSNNNNGMLRRPQRPDVWSYCPPWKGKSWSSHCVKKEQTGLRAPHIPVPPVSGYTPVPWSGAENGREVDKPISATYVSGHLQAGRGGKGGGLVGRVAVPSRMHAEVKDDGRAVFGEGSDGKQWKRSVEADEIDGVDSGILMSDLVGEKAVSKRNFWDDLKGGMKFKLWGQSGLAGVEWDPTPQEDGDDLKTENPFETAE